MKMAEIDAGLRKWKVYIEKKKCPYCHNGKYMYGDI